MADFRMPSLGADMEYATLVEWRVAPGAAVKRGDIIAEVETQKGNVEVEVFESGVVEDLVVTKGTRVPVGGVMAHIRGGDGAGAPLPAAPATPTAAPAAPIAVPSVVAPPLPVGLSAPPVTAPPATAPRSGVRASPAARRLAAEHGVELSSLAGTGPAGAITVADVERAASAPATPTPAPPSAEPHRVSPAARREAEALGVNVEGVRGTGDRGVVTKLDVEHAAASAGASRLSPPAPPPSAMRQAIAAAMTRANREIPHYYLATDVDVGRAVRWLEEQNRARAVTDRVLPAALLLKAVARALREVPDLNGFWIDDAFQAGAGVHLGIAISLRGGGLVAPAIHDADTLPVDALMHALSDLVQRARTGKLRGSELTDPTITVTNLGDLGVRTVFGVIYPPQVALVGLGRIAERPWAIDGMLGVRPVLTVTLAADHRASDGHRGGRLLTAIDRLLQTPEQL